MATKAGKRGGAGRKTKAGKGKPSGKVKAKAPKRFGQRYPSKPTELDFFGRPHRAPRASRKAADVLSRAMGERRPGRKFKGPPPGPPLPPVQLAKLLANSIRAKLRRELAKRKPSPAKEAELRQLLSDAEAHARFLTGPDAYTHSGGPLAGAGVQLMGDWTFSKTSHEENKLFKSGDALLGYIENRPGVVGILALERIGGAEGARTQVNKSLARSPAQTVQAVSRLKDSPMVQNAAPEKRAQMIAWLWDAFEAADENGCWVEWEVDFDS